MGSTGDYGLEYHPFGDLDAPFDNHPQWYALCQNITEGVDYPLDPANPAKCTLHLQEAIAHGNHCFASGASNKTTFLSLSIKDINLGYAFALPLNILPCIVFA
eukprot:13407274-Ditylum_brightwellii.AAC.2